MKTAISIPDDVFSSGERAAKRLKVSRSELYSRALGEFLARHEPGQVTESWDAVVSDLAQPEEYTHEVARRVFEKIEW